MTRDQKLIAIFAALTVLTGGTVGTHLVVHKPPPIPVISEDIAVAPDGRVTVQFVGETMLGGEFTSLAEERGQSYDWPFDALRSSLSPSTYTVAVAGAPFTDILPPAAPPAAVFDTAKPAAASALARAGIDALTMATDGVSASGSVGVADTMHHVETEDMVPFGAGPDLARAEQPLLLRTEVGIIALVGLGERAMVRARAGAPGTMGMSREAIDRGVALARAAGADWVVAVVHWGDSYAPVQDRQRHLAQMFADAGYDLVVGSGSHNAQPIELIGSMPVVYSTGNFVYGTKGRYRQLGLPGYGLSVGLQLSPDAHLQLDVRCILTDNTIVAFQPRPCTPDEAGVFLPTLNPGLRLEGDRAVLSCNRCFQRGEKQ